MNREGENEKGINPARSYSYRENEKGINPAHSYSLTYLSIVMDSLAVHKARKAILLLTQA